MIITNSSWRYVAGFLLFISLVFGQWWLTWTLAIVFLFIFSSYYEIIITGILYDALYGAALPQFYNFSYVFTVSAFVLFLLAVYLRQKMILYA